MTEEVEIRNQRAITVQPITLLGFMISVKNQNPLSRGGLKKVSRKSRDIQSHSQRRCELKSADSRAVTKRGLFDCEPVSLITVFINENKCITVVRIQP